MSDTDTVGLEAGDLVKIPAGAEPDDVRSIRDAVARAKRNAAIREAYDDLRDENGRFPDGYEAARERVAKQFSVSKSTVTHVLKGS